MRTWKKKTSRLLEARENASDKGAIDFSFESNRLKKLTQVFWIKKQATQSETKAKLVGLLLTVIWKFLCTLARRTAKQKYRVFLENSDFCDQVLNALTLIGQKDTKSPRWNKNEHTLRENIGASMDPWS